MKTAGAVGDRNDDSHSFNERHFLENDPQLVGHLPVQLGMKDMMIWGLIGAAVTPLCMFLGWFFFPMYVAAIPGLLAGEYFRFLGADLWVSAPLGGLMIWGFYGWLRSKREPPREERIWV